jgi:hypothetical protein
MYPTPTKGEPRRRIEIVRTIPAQVVSAGYHVGWRYVTKGRKFVMVRDTHYHYHYYYYYYYYYHHDLDGGQVLVSRSAFSKLCRSRNGCDPDDSSS